MSGITRISSRNSFNVFLSPVISTGNVILTDGCVEKFGDVRAKLPALVTRLESAVMQDLIRGAGGAEPPAADSSVDGGARGARLIHRRQHLTRPFEVSGFCLDALVATWS
jgi:hypothetical protein